MRSIITAVKNSPERFNSRFEKTKNQLILLSEEQKVKE